MVILQLPHSAFVELKNVGIQNQLLLYVAFSFACCIITKPASATITTSRILIATMAKALWLVVYLWLSIQASYQMNQVLQNALVHKSECSETPQRKKNTKRCSACCMSATSCCQFILFPNDHTNLGLFVCADISQLIDKMSMNSLQQARQSNWNYFFHCMYYKECFRQMKIS